jgi:hypothetical protein
VETIDVDLEREIDSETPGGVASTTVACGGDTLAGEGGAGREDRWSRVT